HIASWNGRSITCRHSHRAPQTPFQSLPTRYSTFSPPSSAVGWGDSRIVDIGVTEPAPGSPAERHEGRSIQQAFSCRLAVCSPAKIAKFPTADDQADIHGAASLAERQSDGQIERKHEDQ